jgi:outer membrane protein assembly factor BamB
MRSDPVLLNGQLYIGNDDGGVYSLNETTGARLWRFETGGPVYAGPTLSAAGDVLFIGTVNGSEFALRATDGHELWRYSTGSPIGSTATLAQDGRFLYFGAYDASLYAVVASTGALVWRTQLGGAIGSESRLTPDGTLLIVGSHDGSVYALNTADDGTVVWTYRTELRYSRTRSCPSMARPSSSAPTIITSTRSTLRVGSPLGISAAARKPNPGSH